MTFHPRTLPVPALLLTLALAAAPDAFPQEAAATAEPLPQAAAAEQMPAAAAPGPRGSHEVRSDFGTLLRQSPPELATILSLDPTLLSNEAFLAGYPELSRFVATHPEVRRNPRFFLAEFSHSEGGFENALEPLLIFATFGVIAFAISWLIRTLIEQRRWSRLSRTQSEVHNKILERFGTSEALLEYMRSPAGAKFLESAPIPLHAEGATPSAPIARAIWSVQLGLVVAAGALGMLLVSGRFDPDTAEGFYALGVIALCIGGGFIASALVSLFLSRKLGLWQGPGAPRSEELE